ncbi:hypothetical protein GCM10010230_03600 [Streptomyces narbonensis]|nr:hypothetical protein GCM10010230_03600 [Streptomyces narbonensis]
MRDVAAGALGGAVLRLLAVGARLLLRVAVRRLLRRHALRSLLGVPVTRLGSLRLAVRARLLRLLAVRARLAVGPGLLGRLAAVRAGLVVAHRQVPLTGCLCLPNILAEAMTTKCGGGHTVTEPKRFGTRRGHP